MNIIIAGGGQVGVRLAQGLASEGHDITLVDRDSETIETASNKLDIICCLGSATSRDTLEQAGAGQADILIAVTDSDEANMICALIARRLGTKYTVARIRDPEYLPQREFLREVIGLSVIINPEYECAREISRVLRFPTAVRAEVFSRGSANLLEYCIPEGSPLDGLRLGDWAGRFGATVVVAAAERGDEALIPGGDFVLSAGDRLSIIGEERDMRRFLSAIGQNGNRARNVLIMGGSRTGVYLAELLEEDDISVSVLEGSEARCSELCDLIPRANIIHGNGTYDEVLLEAGIREADAFVTLTDDDGDNIVTAMFAKRFGVPKAVVKVEHRHFSDMLDGSSDTMVIPKEIVSQQIVSFVRAISNSAGWNSIETVHRLAGGRIEAVEIKIGPGAGCVGRRQDELTLPKGVRIRAVIRGEKTLICSGSTVIESGDHVVAVAPAGMLRDINDITGGKT